MVLNPGSSSDRSKNSHFRVADRPADYKRLEIAPVGIAEFEDGQRIGTEKGRYEWWYFDAHLDDGATVVEVFYTKPNVSPNMSQAMAPRQAELVRHGSYVPWGRARDAVPYLADTRRVESSSAAASADVTSNQ